MMLRVLVDERGLIVAQDADQQAKWLEIIGKALTYLCLQQASTKEPEKFYSVLKRVQFLESLGMTQNDAAAVVGSSAKSVGELRRRTKGSANASVKKKTRRRRS